MSDLAQVTQAEAVSFLESATRNWENVSFNKDDLEDVRDTLERFTRTRLAAIRTVPADGPDHEFAWREMHDHLSWMQGNKALPIRYLGWNFAAIANDLIDAAYPGLRAGVAPAMVKQPDVEAVARAIMHRNRDYGMDPFPEDATPSDYEISMAKAALSITSAREAKMVEALTEARDTLKHASIFIRSREKMHPCGVELYDQTVDTIDQALAGGA